jgi:signal transduction histidine kinase
MMNMQKTTICSEISASTLCQLSEIASQDASWKLLLDNLFTFTRKEFIIDNLAIFQSDDSTKRLDVIYAKSFGRGKAGEADVSWGDSIAIQAAQEKKMIYDIPSDINDEDRLNYPFTIALPFHLNNDLLAVIVYIRFGGPAYTDADINFIKFLSEQVGFILQRKLLLDFSEKIRKQLDMTDLQQNFINTISHELRNPLGFIKGYTTTLLREDTQWDKTTQTDFLRIIERETNHLQELIDNLLDSSRLQSGQMSFDWQIVRLDSLIRDEVSRARINNPNQIFHLDFDAVVPPIHADPNRLAQVFDNLINNSIKYAPGAEIFITIRHTGKTILVDYRDSGPGISEKYLSQIFDRFFRDPEQSIKVHGSGLGLSICQEIIEKHLGEITASCPPGWGLTFTIHLPVDLETSTLNEMEAK